MQASIAEPAVLSRIGLTLDEVMDDVLTEPYPSAIKELLSAQQRPNVLCALVQALPLPGQTWGLWRLAPTPLEQAG
jgi:hypothetical protein